MRSYFQLSHRKEVRSNASRDCFIAARGDVEGKPNTHQKHKHTHTIVILTLLFVAVESFWFPQCVVQKSVRGSGAIGASRALAPPRLRKATSICLPITKPKHFNTIEIWLILPVVICLFQGLSHACLRITALQESAHGSLHQTQSAAKTLRSPQQWITWRNAKLIHESLGRPPLTRLRS